MSQVREHIPEVAQSSKCVGLIVRNSFSFKLESDQQQNLYRTNHADVSTIATVNITTLYEDELHKRSSETNSSLNLLDTHALKKMVSNIFTSLIWRGTCWTEETSKDNTFA